MGGAAAGPEAVRGRRALDAAINLVPYVDILMTLMVFLVMCAIFTQISSLTVHSKNAGGGEPVDAKDVVALSVVVKRDGVIVEHEGKRIEATRNAAEIERAIRDVVPNVNADTLCTMRSDDGVSYGELIEIIDLTRRIGVTQVSLEPAST